VTAAPPQLLKARIRHSWMAGVAIVLVLLITDGSFKHGGMWRAAFEWLGYAALVVCVLGRAWCSAYIGGRKKYELISMGPYSVVRNPLYLFSFIGVVGIGFCTGVVTFLILLPLLFASYYRLVVRREEAFMMASFGDDFARYASRVPRWLPDFKLWQDVPEIAVRPHYLLFTLRDSAAFFIAFPLLDLIQTLHGAGVLPALLRLP
jgi:protein-S-isoprenylcysteine O-methyltransferase Ste14